MLYAFKLGRKLRGEEPYCPEKGGKGGSSDKSAKYAAEAQNEGIKFVRIDLFELGGKIYFSEFTFFHGGGFNRFYPVEWETRLGNLIDIDTK